VFSASGQIIAGVAHAAPIAGRIVTAPSPAFADAVGEGWRAEQQQRNGENEMPHGGASTNHKIYQLQQ
jgi:hypothetical protein